MVKKILQCLPIAFTTLLRCRALIAASAVLLAGATSPSIAQGVDAVVVKINGVEVHRSELALVEEELGSGMPQGLTDDAKRDLLISHLTDIILLDRAAVQQGLDSSDDFKRRNAMQRTRLTGQLLLKITAAKATTDEALHKAYDDAAKQLANVEEIRARQILVATEEDAKAIAAELANGKDFAELARQKSKDPGASQGGDLGFFTRDQMVPEFSNAAFALEVGKVSSPVKTVFGFHIIKVEEKRKKPVPPFDEVKDQLRDYIAQKSRIDLVTKLRTGAKIEFIDGKAKP